MQLTVVESDITTLEVDAVVNAANRGMRGGGGVDGAIHRAAGPGLLEECERRFPDGLATGAAGWTEAGNLPCRWVIHVVGPNRRAGQTDPDLLASCYREALRVADELGASRLAPSQVREAQLVAFNAEARDAWESATGQSEAG
jgi:O-acetyl-ADP-ribose deacetylase (regulator of RNase III)